MQVLLLIANLQLWLALKFRSNLSITRNVTHLGREVEAQVAATRQVVLDQQGHLAGQADLDLVGQSGSLAEVDQVLERECQGNGLRQLNLDVEVGLLDVGVASESNSTVTNIAVARELDTVLGGFDADY